jgi:hypothetical protein
MICNSKISSTILLASLAFGSSHASAAQTSYVDVMDAGYLPDQQRVIVAGLHGIVGLLEITQEAATLSFVPEAPTVDFTSLKVLSDSNVLLGSSTGMLYRYDGNVISEVQQLSEYNEPILDIESNESGIWAVGGRGLITKSVDGINFEEVVIEEVSLPLIQFPAGFEADWYIGASNLNIDTLEFKATVKGKPAVDGEDYILYPVEGFVQFQTELDMDPAPTIKTKFTPGPPYRHGDVSWNVVMLNGSVVTLAGEFGMILQSYDAGETWVRRDTQLTPREPEPAYWMAGVQDGETVVLAGAAGVNKSSSDSGLTWEENTKPGREGIFGVALNQDGAPVISGAVGLIGAMSTDGEWQLADRTELKLLSWIKTPVSMPDGSLLVLGGRGTAITIADGKMNRLPMLQ